MKAVIDTNILIDLLKGEVRAADELDQYSTLYVSIVTYMEILVGALDVQEEKELRSFLATFEVIDLQRDIAGLAVSLRRKHRMKLPDAIIWASALANEALLVTRNTRDFDRNHPSIRVPYSVC